MRKMQKSDILDKYSLFDHCSERERESLENNSNLVMVAPGKNVFSTGQDVTAIALLGSGMIRVYLIGDTGREITVYYVSPGESCPTNLMCALFNRPCPSEAVTTDDSEALMVSAPHFKKLMDSNPEVRWAVMEGLTHRLTGVMTLVEEVTFKKMDRRLAQLLVGRLPEQHEGQHTISVTHDEIARELGSAREVISRLLLDFEHKGLVSRSRGGISIMDSAGLQEYC